MKFKKGHTKVGGRKKGTRNKRTLLAMKLADAIVQDDKYQKMLRRRMLDPQPPLALEIMLWHYAFGKPVDTTLLKNVKAPKLKTDVASD